MSSGIEVLPTIPVLLLKTRSQPHDTYEEHFTKGTVNTTADSSQSSVTDLPSFAPHFVPVLEHTQNDDSKSRLSILLQTGELKQRYGGMVFTSQRAVEAWAEIVHGVETHTVSDDSEMPGSTPNYQRKDDPFANLELLTPFPLYVVGPATERALQDLAVSESTSGAGRKAHSPYSTLNTSIHGAHTGNGASLATFILEHYNQLYRDHWFTYFEAPRLPFIPLLGMSSQNYGRKRLDGDDPRLRKKPLLFLVGETRRDVIPKTLQSQDDHKLRIEVDEMEVYRTEVMKSFETDLDNLLNQLDEQQGRHGNLRAVVVFSPQGSDLMLKKIGYLSVDGQPTEKSERRWWRESKPGDNSGTEAGWIVVTIGPTTRDYLKETLGVEPDICSEKPNPQSLRNGIENFLRARLFGAPETLP